MRRFLRVAAWIVGTLALVVAILWLTLRHPLPTGGVAGEAADALAHDLERAVGIDAWTRTGAVRWSFRGKFHHLWDRTRSFDRVRWGRNEVLLDVARHAGRAYRDGAEVTDAAETRRLVDKAYGAFINDSFWLNPLAKFFDDGVTRERVELDGRAALVIHYGKGGLTPGDRYVWLPGDDGRPRAWRLYVSVIPIKGLQMSWDGWQTLATGAQIATTHRALGLTAVHLDDVAGAATVTELEPGPDPFAALAVSK
jgi:hypothetical protein